MTKDLILSAILVLFSILMLLVVIPSGISVPSRMGDTQLAPDFWPRVLCYILLVLGAYGLMRDGLCSFKKGCRMRITAQHAEFRQLNVWPVLGGIVFVVLVVPLLPTLGFITVGSLSVLVLGLLYGEKRIGWLVLSAFIMPSTLYFLLTWFAGRNIPAGVLQPLLNGLRGAW